MKGNQIKLGKKQVVLDENRRKTYKQSQPLAGGREMSVLSTFDGERKQLMAVRMMLNIMIIPGVMHEIPVNGGSVFKAKRLCNLPMTFGDS